VLKVTELKTLLLESVIVARIFPHLPVPYLAGSALWSAESSKIQSVKVKVSVIWKRAYKARVMSDAAMVVYVQGFATVNGTMFEDARQTTSPFP